MNTICMELLPPIMKGQFLGSVHFSIWTSMFEQGLSLRGWVHQKKMPVEFEAGKNL